MGLGFEVSESFSGSFYLLREPLVDRAIRCTFKLRVDGIRRFLKERRVDARGTLHADGLCAAGTEVTGTVGFWLLDQRRLPYDLTFFGDDGARYALRGQRDFMMHDATGSLTMLPASLFDSADEEIGRAMLRFDPRTELPALLKSFRPRVRFAG